MSPVLPELAHQVLTGLTVGAAVGWLVFHFVRRDRDAARGGTGCAHCPSNASAIEPARGVRPKQLRVLQ